MVYLISNQEEVFDSTAYQKGNMNQLLNSFSEQEVLGVDTETTGFDPYTCELLMLQIGNEIDQFVIDATTVDLAPVKELLESKLILMHNAKFDCRFLFRQGINPKRIYDTFLAERILSTGIDSHGKSYAACVRRYVGAILDKEVRKNIKFDTRSILYAADDVKYLPKIRNHQLQLLEKENLLHTLALDNEFVRVLAYIEYCGIFLDKEAWKKKADEDKAEKHKREALCNEWVARNCKGTKFVNEFGDLFNPEPRCLVKWSSSKQCIPLFKYLGVDTSIIDKGKVKQSIDAKVLKPQKDVTPLINLYLSYKESEKLCSTYGESFFKLINPVTGRIHTQFTQIMNTGRLSSGGKDKELGVELINLQNIPKDDRTRTCFKSKSGNLLIDADYSGQEQIVLANFSKEPNILEFYRKGLGDMHSYIASKIFPELNGLDLKKIEAEYPEKRQIAKSAGFAINYGGNGQTIADNLSIPTEVGDQVYKAYFSAFPKLKDYFKKCQNSAIKKGYIFFNNITGRKYYIPFFEEFKALHREVNEPGFWDIYFAEKKKNSSKYKSHLKDVVRTYYNYKGTIEKRALNYPIQGTSADITKIAAVKFMQWLEKEDLLFKVLICNMVHDEILVECPEDITDKVAIKLKECMEIAGSYFCDEIPLKAEPCISKVWKH